MSEPLDLTRIARRLREAPDPPGPDPTAAVAAILRPGDGLEILFIKRAEHEGDPWSGHMAFPGGRRDPGDTTLVHTARRETLEEIGLDLDGHGEMLGMLDDVPTHTTGLVVRPFVWAVQEVPGLQPNEEVAAVEWVALETLMSGARDTTFPLTWKGQHHRFPAFEVESGIVWGLTYRMLHLLFETLRAR
ncbi:MAG: CoA pyrophosphatase [Sandaracinaceae bacterium]